MNFTSSKTFLEIYGMLRVMLGIVQLVGILSAYFLAEWVLRYPPDLLANVFDEDVVVLTYLAVFVRGIFHTIVGIGMARLQPWARIWIAAGWPIIILITLGLVFSFYQEWLEASYVASFAQVIAWPQLMVYLALIIGDYLVVNKALEVVEENEGAVQKSGGRMSMPKLTTLIFAIIFFFSALMFFGKSIKQGFHKGFYKSRGERAVKGQPTKVLEPRKAAPDVSPQPAPEPLPPASAPAAASPLDLDKPVLQGMTPKTVMVDPSDKTDPLVQRTVVGEKEGKSPVGVAYKTIVRLAAALCLIGGLLLQLKEVSPLSYGLLGAGFLFWLFDGLVGQNIILGLTAGVCALVCVALASIRKS